MTKRAVVLGGGGTKGSYQIGVWRALMEMGLDFHIVTGTSIGALNGAFLVQGDYEAAVELWENISYDRVFAGRYVAELDTLETRFTVVGGYLREIIQGGGMDTTPLEEMVGEYMDEERLRASPVQFGLVTVEYPALRHVEVLKDEIPQGRMAEYLLASSACFPIFKPRQIDELRYIDGGYRDNLPVELAIRCGAEEVVAVDLGSLGLINRPKATDVPIRYIKSHWQLGSMFQFDTQLMRRNLSLGYYDCLRAFERVEGGVYCFNPGQRRENYKRLLPAILRLEARLRRDIVEALVAPVPSEIIATVIRATQKDRLGRSEDALVAEAAETAGELFLLPPDTLYDFTRFNQKLLEALDGIQLERMAIDYLSEAISLESTPAFLSRIASLDRRHIVAYLVDIIEKTDENSLRRMWLLASALKREWKAAVYLCLIRESLREP
jgi:NTE family protein